MLFCNGRKTGDNTCEATTWRIKVQFKNVYEGGAYKVRLALASATHSMLEVLIDENVVHATVEVEGTRSSIPENLRSSISMH